MKVTLNWLREFVRIELDTAGLCERLTMGGLEVEGVEELGVEIREVIIGEIVSTAPHPHGDRLTLCHVRTGAEATVPVVCGATNMKAGDRVAYAPPGATLPGGRRIERTEIRGMPSNGMLCSEAELGLSDDASGILIVAADGPLGERIGAHLGVEDIVLEVSVTPNRGDCLSVLGLAREVAALTGERMLRLRVSVRERGAPTDEAVKVRIEDRLGCARYTARLVRGVQVAPSPRWVQQRLQAVGVRPINNVVDVTNLVMIERGQPLHAFDYDRLPGREIVVRRAGPSAVITTLDDVERRLESDDLLITTGQVPVAIAGVMGGAETEVSESTKNILLEAAWFDPGTVRRTARRLELRSEAAYRFERGVDIEGVPTALTLAASLFKQLAGGDVAPGIVEDYPEPKRPTPIPVRYKRIEETLGFPLSRSEITATLKSLGAGVAAGPRGTLTMLPPTFRSDLTREIDVIEEVARVAGYHRIPATMPAVELAAGVLPPAQRWVRELKRLLVAYGLSEVIGLSFAASRANELFRGVGVPGEPIVLMNPLSREESELRRSLLSSLLAMWRYNRNQGATSIAGFSIGKVFWRSETYCEGWRLGGVMAGELPSSSLGARRAPEYADAKGVVEALLDRFHLLDGVRWEQPEGTFPFHPGKTAAIRLAGEPIGIIAALHPDVEVELEVEGPHWLFELDMEKLLPYFARRRVFRGLPRYPAVVRDLAVVVDTDFASDRIVQFVRQWRRGLVEDVALFDEYFGAPIPAGKKSLAYSISYRAPDRTLTDEEVNVLQDELTAALQRHLPLDLRQ